MCIPRVAMIATFVLAILFLCHSHACLPQNSKGDFPDANEVMWKLPLTYMLQSLGNYTNLLCGYRRFYNETHKRDNKTYQKSDLIFLYRDGREFSQPRYVREVINYTIHMANRPEQWFPARYKLEILFSDMNSCMITRNPDTAFPKACNLMVTRESFPKPPEICLSKFQQHCKSTGFRYTIGNCPEPKTR
ncbi:uncharacterized protein LOC120844802 [Ixodes scapularis]|uniref:uncharacterized protein LOC120844802 n=1 Tax=Ixodes scapularis TaxID=6945 RepID=UPI001A9F6887|nr:uncharacterized protein LOC120844802 [Ixodes scapularis]